MRRLLPPLVALLWALSGLLAADSWAVEPAPVSLPDTPDAEVEPNGSTAASMPIAGATARIRGQLFPTDDVDVYALTGAAGDRLFASVMTQASADNGSNAQLTLLGPDGTTVIEADSNNGGFNDNSPSIAGATLPTAGTYFLRINTQTGNSTTRPYDLYVRRTSVAATPEVEGNDSAATANALPASGLVAGARNPADAGELDYYKLDLQAGDTIFASLDLDPERDGTTFNGQLAIGVFGEPANQLLTINDAGTADAIPSEANFATVEETGTYLLVVSAPDAAVGGPTATYNLAVTVFGAEQPGCRSYTAPVLTNVPDLRSATVTWPGVDPARVGRVAVQLQLTHDAMIDLDAELQAPGGAAMGLFTDIGSSASGVQARMDAVFDEYAALPAVYPVTKGLMLQTDKREFSLRVLEGLAAGGDWHLVVRDDAVLDEMSAFDLARLIVCPQPAEPDGTTVFSADFETGDQGFSHSGTADEWERGTPDTPATTQANPVAALSACKGGTGCFKTDLDDTYEGSSSQDLLSPDIDLTGRTGPIKLSWESWLQMENASFDHATVTVQEAGGANPRKVWEWSGFTMAGPMGNPTVNVPFSSGWTHHLADISDFAGKHIRVRFHLDSDTSINYAGLAIDDVRVFDLGPPPAATPTSTATPTSEPTAAPTTAPTTVPTAVPTATPQVSGPSITPKGKLKRKHIVVNVSCGSAPCIIQLSARAIAKSGRVGTFKDPRVIRGAADRAVKVRFTPRRDTRRRLRRARQPFITITATFSYQFGQVVRHKTLRIRG